MKCQYKEYDRLLTEQFISGFNNNGMINEIVRGVVTLEDIKGATSKHVLLWDRVETQRAQILKLIDTKETKEFDVVRHSMRKHDHVRPGVQKKVGKCKYLRIGTMHPLQGKM